VKIVVSYFERFAEARGGETSLGMPSSLFSLAKPSRGEQKGPEGRRVNEFSLELTKGGPALFNNRICPFGNRAWWAAIEKKIEFDYIHVDLGDSMLSSYSVSNSFCCYVNVLVDREPL